MLLGTALRHYSQFANNYEFKHHTSSIYHPQRNGEAKRATRTVKELLKKGDYPHKTLLACQSMESGFSPSDLLMRRILKTTVPMTAEQRFYDCQVIPSLWKRVGL